MVEAIGAGAAASFSSSFILTCGSGFVSGNASGSEGAAAGADATIFELVTVGAEAVRSSPASARAADIRVGASAIAASFFVGGVDVAAFMRSEVKWSLHCRATGSLA